MNTTSNLTDSVDAPAPPLLYEMIRSFVALARTLNLSHAVAELGSTRQTVRRHISQLEEMAGHDLFLVGDRRYQLTTQGRDALPEAQNILARCNVWAKGSVVHQNGLPQYRIQYPNGGTFHQQQQPLSTVWRSDRPLLAAALKAWALSDGALESPYFQAVRPYAMVYRNTPNGWICVELGQESSYVSWFGLDNARSSVGRVLGDLPGGPDIARLLSRPFRVVERDWSARVDHIATQIPRNNTPNLTPICYARLLLGCTFPDGSFALVSMVDRHNDIEIPNAEITLMSPDLVMEIDPDLLNQEH